MAPSGYYYYSGPLLEYLRTSVTQGAANAYVEATMPTPVAKQLNVAMLIHEAEFSFSALDAVVDKDNAFMHLARSSQSSVLEIDDEDCITKLTRQFEFTTSGLTQHDLPVKWTPARSVIYGKSNLYFGFDTAGQAGAENGYCRVGYTLAEVDPHRLYDALTD